MAKDDKWLLKQAIVQTYEDPSADVRWIQYVRNHPAANVENKKKVHSRHISKRIFRWWSLVNEVKINVACSKKICFSRFFFLKNIYFERAQ